MKLIDLPGVAANDYWNGKYRGSVRMRIEPENPDEPTTFVFFWISRAKGKKGMVFASLELPWHRDANKICAHGVEGAYVAAKMKGWIK